MAQPQIGHITQTVGTSVILLFQAPVYEGAVDLVVHNEGGSKVYLGDETITTSGDTEGFSLNNGTTINMTVAGGTQIYALSASSSKVCILYSV
jgi:hypothetical protein